MDSLQETAQKLLKAQGKLPARQTLSAPDPLRRDAQRLVHAQAGTLQRVTAHAPLTGLAGDPQQDRSEVFVRTAANKGVEVRRAAHFSRQCDTPDCANWAAWVLDGIPCCNSHHETVLARLAKGAR